MESCPEQQHAVCSADTTSQVSPEDVLTWFPDCSLLPVKTSHTNLSVLTKKHDTQPSDQQEMLPNRPPEISKLNIIQLTRRKTPMLFTSVKLFTLEPLMKLIYQTKNLSTNVNSRESKSGEIGKHLKLNHTFRQQEVAQPIFSAHTADHSFTTVCIKLIFLWHSGFQAELCEKCAYRISNIWEKHIPTLQYKAALNMIAVFPEHCQL